MKKRILCLILAVLMLVPLVFTSCSNEASDEDIINNIISGGEIALTLSIWIPTDSDTNSTDFKDRLTEVQNEINAILLDKNYSTKVELVAIKDSEYEAKLAERFASMKVAVDKNGSAYATADKYINSAIKNELDMYELFYPPVLDSQMDIFLIRGYEDYVSHVNAGNTQKLDAYISQNGSLYSNIHKLIRPNILSQMKVNGNTFAIPNNHLYADKYQYVLIDKDIFDSQSEIDISSISSILDCKAYIEAVGAMGLSSVVPFVGTLNDAPGIAYMDKDNMIGGTLSNGAPASIIENEAYISYISMYKALQASSYVKEDLADGEKAAVKFFYGTKQDAEALADSYYLVKSTRPVATIDDVYSSMFAISSYSANYDRSMKVLYLLQTDEEIRTLLQYGIANKDYELNPNDDGEKVITIKDTAYKMNILYTGNGYYTYPGDGLTMNDWKPVKDVNYDMVVSPYIRLEYYLNSGKLSQADAEKLATLKEAVKPLTEELNASVEQMTLAELESFLSAYAIDIKATEASISTLTKKIEGLNIDITALKEKLAKETVEAEKTKLQASIDAKTATLNETNTELAKANALKAEHDANALVVKLHASSEYSQLIELYKQIFNNIK